MIAAAQTVPFDFWQSLTGSLNVPVLALVAIVGLCTGWICAKMAPSFFAQSLVFPAAVMLANILTAFQFATGAGASLYRPNNTPNYLVGHVAYILVGAIFSVAVGFGANLGIKRTSPAVA